MVGDEKTFLLTVKVNCGGGCAGSRAVTADSGVLLCSQEAGGAGGAGRRCEL